jgi:hypothetical protein
MPDSEAQPEFDFEPILAKMIARLVAFGRHRSGKPDDFYPRCIYADERQRQRFFRVECEGSAWQIESELELYTQHPHTDPVTPPPHPETVPHTPLERPLAARVSE